MLNVSATQELAKRLLKLEAEKASLQSQVNELQSLKADVEMLKNIYNTKLGY